MATAIQILEAIDNAIFACIEGGYSEYTIAGRGKKKYSLDELRRMRREYAAIARNESSTGGLKYRRGISCD